MQVEKNILLTPPKISVLGVPKCLEMFSSHNLKHKNEENSVKSYILLIITETISSEIHHF